MILTESMNHLFANLAQGQGQETCGADTVVPAGTQGNPVSPSQVRGSILGWVGILFFFFWRSSAGLR